MRIFYVQAINANSNANMGFICYVLDRYLPVKFQLTSASRA